MNKNTILHYKKVFSKYTTTTFHNYCDVKVDKPKSNRFRKVVPFVWNQESIVSENSEETFVKNFSNKLTEVYGDYLTIVVEEVDNKISLKCYHTQKVRRVGKPYFKIIRHINYFTFNIKTNNFYFGDIMKSKKRTKSNKIRVNNFEEGFLSRLILTIRRLVRDLSSESTIISSNLQGDHISNEILYVFFSLISTKKNMKIDNNVSDIDSELFRFYLQVNGFKYPDSYKNFKYVSFPKNKLRKNNNIVSLIINELNLGGDKVRRIFNQLDNFDIIYIYILYHILGVDYFNKLDDSVLQAEFPHRHIKFDNVKKTFVGYSLNNYDKVRIVKLLNKKLKIHLLLDHLMMIHKLQNEYGFKFKMRFNDITSFDNEHYELSNILSSYQNGTITRDYGDNVDDLIEEPIVINNTTYYPILLKNTFDYNDESHTQSNCVRSYIDSAHSIIISLRENESLSKERATIEYQFSSNQMVRTQSLGKFNKNLKLEYNEPIRILDSRINELYKKNVLLLPTIVKKYSDGTETKRISTFDKSHFIDQPIWNYENFLTDIQLF